MSSTILTHLNFSDIQKIKAALKRRHGQLAPLHVLYNLVRELPPERGFSSSWRLANQARLTFVRTALAAPRIATELGLALTPAQLTRLQDAARKAAIEAAGPGTCPFQHPLAYRWAMEATPHGTTSTVREHGRDCARRYAVLRVQLRQGAVPADAPDFMRAYGLPLLRDQLPAPVVGPFLEYHDVGKAATIERDTQGRLHFPGHAKASALIWRQLSIVTVIAELMEHDMALHTLTASEALQRVPRRLLPTLMLTTWAELQSNAESLFGGVTSKSYRAKRKAFEARAREICQVLYGNEP